MNSSDDEVLSGTRQNLDFTDQLWLILHKVESLNELSAALTFVFKTIQLEEIRPHLYPNSNLQITDIIHRINRGGEDGLPKLEGRLPLEILVEIGLEKLKRDYLHSFMSNYLASREELSPFVLSPKVTTDEKLAAIFSLTPG